MVIIVGSIICGFKLQDTNQTSTCNSGIEPVNVLIYAGEGATTSSVNGLIYCLEQSQKTNPNIQFNYTTSYVIIVKYVTFLTNKVHIYYS